MGYPSELWLPTNPTADDTLDSVEVPHAQQHADVNNEVAAIEAELGANLRGPYLTVGHRLAAIEAQTLLPIAAVKATATARTLTAVLAADPHLTADLPAEATYHFELIAHFTSASPTAALAWGMSAPVGAVGFYEGTVTTAAAFPAATLASTEWFTSFGAGSTDDFPIEGGGLILAVRGTITTGETEGAVAFLWAQREAEALALTAAAGSSLLLSRVT